MYLLAYHFYLQWEVPLVSHHLELPIYGNQLPPIPRFTGEEDLSESGSFPDWFEQYEAVATLAGWDEHAKLVNLTACLRGTTYSFYHSCTGEQRSNYKLLVE